MKPHHKELIFIAAVVLGLIGGCGGALILAWVLRLLTPG
jgi:hypothetical protein